MDFGRFSNFVLILIILSLRAPAIVKVLKIDPSSYTPFVILLINFISGFSHVC